MSCGFRMIDKVMTVASRGAIESGQAVSGGIKML